MPAGNGASTTCDTYIMSVGRDSYQLPQLPQDIDNPTRRWHYSRSGDSGSVYYA